MSLSLTILPVSTEDQCGNLICITAMDLYLSTVSDAFREMDVRIVENKVYGPPAVLPKECFELDAVKDSPYIGGPHQNSFYGEIQVKLFYVCAGEIKKIFRSGYRAESLLDANEEERAAVAYVRELNDETKIIIYWWWRAL